MTRARTGAVAALALSLALGLSGDSSMPDRLFTFRHENVLGTSLEIKVASPSAEEAAIAEAAALNEIDRLAKILSAWDPESEFSRWMRTSGEAVRVSPELAEVLDLFEQWGRLSGGALNPAAEAVARVWRQAAAQNRMPAPADLQAAVQAAGRTHWTLNRAAGTARHRDDTPLVLASFAKSYIVSKAADAARAAADTRGIAVNIGGDLVVRGELAEPVHIADPRADAENDAPVARLEIHDRAVATSGSYRRGVTIAGTHYSHIVDPRNGLPAGEVISATVVSPDAVEAGALATAFSVLGVEQSRALAAQRKGVEYLLLARDGRVVASDGWAPLLLAAAPAPAPAQQASGAGMEVVLQFELARIADQRYRRPFVAAWVEDKDKFPVRTFALWYDKPRWLPDMRAWYRADRMRALAEGSDITASVSSATRPPGKYSVKWDGNDNAGKPVKPGRYTICLEAAREHGTYQLIRQEIDFPGTPKQIPLTGNVEITTASLEIRKAVGR